MAVRRAASIGWLCLAACGARTDLAAGGLEGAGAGTEELPCVPGTFTLVRAIPAVMLLIDASRSMSFDLGESQTARWTVLGEALASTLPPVDATMQIGALLFPSVGGGDLTCEVSSPALAPATGNVGPLLDLMASRTPDGATPTADAVHKAAESLREVRAASTARSLVLATDGGPNCNAALDPASCTCTIDEGCMGISLLCLDGARTVDTIASTAALGMPTYVIGIAATGGDEFAAVLDAMAVAGGRPRPGDGPRYYAADSPTDLTDALASIRDQVGACTFLTASVPDADGTITVSIDGAEVPYDPANASGWSWGDRANGEVFFSGAACETVSSGGHTLEATVTCDAADASAP
jgi:hypothetical protein